MNQEEYIKKFLKEFTKNMKEESSKEEQSSSAQYNYMNVELEEVMNNPDEYIIKECQPACYALWDKNIETYMVSNYDDENLYVLMCNLSKENIAIMDELSQKDPRFFYDKYRGTYGIRAKGMTAMSSEKLKMLTDVFVIQDTLRYDTAEEFLEEYKRTDGEIIVKEGKTIIIQNPDFANVTLQEALEKSGKTHLYEPSEGRVYESEIYLKWHKKYEDAKEQELKENLSALTTSRHNIDGDLANLRDTFLHAERAYVFELLKDDKIQELIYTINSYNTSEIAKEAQKLIDKVENGEISEEQMEIVEKQIIVLLAAIQDKILIKELVLTMNQTGRTRH